MISATTTPTAIDRGVNSRMCAGFWGSFDATARIVCGRGSVHPAKSGGVAITPPDGCMRHPALWLS